jgi:hypothetical protein
VTIRAMPRALVLLRRIAEALERVAPPVRRPVRRVEFSLATDKTFEAGYEERQASEDR